MEHHTYVVVGTQWGDEGKGKVIDVLGDKVDYVVRFQGGNNAGHTVIVHDQKYVLHLLPSGVLHQNARCIIGAGVVVDVAVLHEELQGLEERGMKTDHVFIDYRTQLIMPYHIAEDTARERMRGEYKIGTTKRGIGPAYMDKISRVGIRVADLLNKESLKQKIKLILAEKNPLLSNFGERTYTEDEVYALCLKYYEILKDRIIDGVAEINMAYDTGKKIMFEGAQAVMLDIDHGTYPYVTSSSPTSGGIASGAGFAPTKLQNIFGVSKAYTTRVGSGIFPTELFDEIGTRICEIGREFGSTTGRKRRVGWLDLVALKYATMLNGLSYHVITKLDVLSGIDELKVAVAYKINGKEYTQFPSWVEETTEIEIVYQTFKGWTEDIALIQEYEQLPEEAKKYLEFIETYTGTPIAMISVGPERTQNIYKIKMI